MRRRVAVCSALLGLVASLLTLTAQPSAAAEPTFTFDGGGWGHGLGMSQYGAYARALAGQQAEEIVAFYYPGTTLAQGPTTNDLRVHIGDTSSTTTFTPLGSGTASVLVDGAHVADVATNQALRVGRTADGFSVDVGGDTCGGSCPGSVLEVQFTQGQPIRAGVTGLRYMYGRFSVRRTSTGLSVVVRGMTFENYLYGLDEIGTSWPAEAQQAQAIAARSYSAALATRPVGGVLFDLYDDARSQVFSGAEVILRSGGHRWKAAVDATQGQMLTYNGAPIEALYSSSHGGHSENNAYVNGTHFPYLVAQPDPFDGGAGANPFHTWSATFTGSELGRILERSYGVTLGVVQDIEITGQVGASGRLDKATLVVSGTAGSVRTSGSRFKWAVGDNTLRSTKFTITSSAVPQTQLAGNLDAVTVDGTRAVFSGWTVDPSDPTQPNEVSVRIGARTVVTQPAAGPRQDVDTAFGYGPNHGFEVAVTFATGTHEVCVVARPLEGGGERQLGCRTVTITASNPPVGNLDAVQLIGGRLLVSGWALDWDDLGRRTQIEVDVDGAVSRHTADRTRTDVATAMGAGPNHGFRIVLDTVPGAHRVCATALDTSPGTAHTPLGCRTVDVPVPALAAPIGSLDAVRPTTEAVLVSGWAVDRDQPGVASQVSVTVDGAPAGTITADRPRSDVHAAFGLGPAHGFRAELPVAPGRHEVCITARDLAPGTSHTPLGCRTVDVPAAQVASTAPVASLDAAIGAHRRITLAGWAFDPDGTAAVSVRVTLNGAAAGTFAADRPRGDVAAAHGVGPTHGFLVDIGAEGGTHEVCIEVLDLAPGSEHTDLGCRQVEVSSAPPVGYVDAVETDGGAVVLHGWAADQDVDGPIPVEVFLDGEWVGRWNASLVRGDVAEATGLGPRVGFTLRIPTTGGTHEVCVYAVDHVPGQEHVVLGCRTVTV